MNIKINEIELPKDIAMHYGDRYAFSGVTSIEEFNLDGSLSIWEGLVQGRTVSIYGTESTGVIDKKTLDQLFALSTSPNVVFVVQYNDGRRVLARFVRQESPIQAVPVALNKPIPEDSDIYHSLQIKIMEIAEI